MFYSALGFLIRKFQKPHQNIKSIGNASASSSASLKNVQCMSHKFLSTPKQIRPSVFYHYSQWRCWSLSQLPWRARAGLRRARVASSITTSESPVNRMCMFLGCWRELEKLWTPQQPSCSPSRHLLKVTSWRGMSICWIEKWIAQRCKVLGPLKVLCTTGASHSFFPFRLILSRPVKSRQTAMTSSFGQTLNPDVFVCVEQGGPGGGGVFPLKRLHYGCVLLVFTSQGCLHFVCFWPSSVLKTRLPVDFFW